MKNIKITVNAKINLTLGILGTTQNNYHILESVMASVNISDAVSLVKRNDKTIYLSSRNMAVGARNSAVKAANAFVEAFNTAGVDINLRKNIPFAGGLGGSSADAAAVIAGMGKLFDITDKDALKKVAAGVGSDVPYMLEGGYKLVGGTGEEVKNIDTDITLYFVLAKPERGVSTAECYRVFDSLGGGALPDNKTMIRALTEKNLKLIAENTVNNLEPAAVSLMPEIGEIKKLLENEKPMTVFMTGSGSAVVALCESKQQADFIASRIKDKVFFSGSFETVPCGMKFD